MKTSRKVVCPSRPVARPRQDRGVILIAATLMIVALMAAALVAVRRTTISADHVGRDYHDEQVFQVADGGANAAEDWLRHLLMINHDPTQADLDVAPSPYLPGYTFNEYSITKMPFQEQVFIPRGPFEGLYADMQPYEIRSHVQNQNSSIEHTVVVTVNQAYLQLFDYAIFYDGDLELFPRNPSTYVGRIHSNGNIYLGSESNFDIIGSVTAAGHIYNTPKDPTLVYRGKARIADLAGQWHDLSYDWRDPDWLEQSLTDWDGLVQDSAHGVTRAPFPISTLPDPIDIIKRGDMLDDSLHHALRYYWRAGLRITDNFAVDSVGNIMNIAGLITSESVYDWREGHNMEMRTLRIDSLIARGLVPTNGVIYISYSHENAAVRMAGGAMLPDGGLVIASDNPVYVQGNYNTIDKQPASVFCDAFNLYSNNWNDGNANKNLNFRNATPTAINTCVVTGDKPTTTGHYSGGAQNLIRLHEKWLMNAELTYRGSLVCLWASEQAEGYFVDGPPVFRELHRDSGFDPDLLDPEFWPNAGLHQILVLRSRWESF